MLTPPDPDRVREAMEQFDTHQRQRYWKGWEHGRTADWAIDCGGRRYPLRHIMFMVSRDYGLCPVGQLRELLQTSGFTVVALKGRQRAAQAHKAPVKRFGDFMSEQAFCQRFLVPLVEQMGYQPVLEYPCSFYTGRAIYHGRVDVMVCDGDQAIAVIEAKHTIRSAYPHDKDIAQARSYALNLGLHTFLIAAPERIWVYRLVGARETLLRVLTPDEQETLGVTLQQVMLGHAA